MLVKSRVYDDYVRDISSKYPTYDRVCVEVGLSVAKRLERYYPSMIPVDSDIEGAIDSSVAKVGNVDWNASTLAGMVGFLGKYWVYGGDILDWYSRIGCYLYVDND